MMLFIDNDNVRQWSRGMTLASQASNAGSNPAWRI